MKIISHRGYWKINNEKNTSTAFLRSFSLGYGTETDIRDYHGKLLISHDIPTGQEMFFSEILKIANNYAITQGEPLTLALNIKADGLASGIKQELANYPALDCFVFDMSVPDMLSYFSEDIPTFTRMSEVEPQPAWLEHATGIWLDAFSSEWYSTDLIQHLLNNGKRVCLVSPELHQRPHLALWERIKSLKNSKNLMLCTDFPEEASQFFHSVYP